MYFQSNYQNNNAHLNQKKLTIPNFGAMSRKDTLKQVVNALKGNSKDQEAKDSFITRFGKDQLPRLEAEIKRGEKIADHTAYTSLSHLGRNITPEPETRSSSTNTGSSSNAKPHDILKKRRGSFEREYKTGGTQAVVNHFGAPVTKNVAEWFARLEKIKTNFRPHGENVGGKRKKDSGASGILSNRRGSFEREYKAGGTQAVVNHFGAPVTRDIAKKFASKHKIKRSS